MSTLTEQRIHVGDTGTRITLVLQDQGSALDVSSASTLECKLTRPDGTSVDNITLSLTTSGADGSVFFLSLVSHFTLAGYYKLQAHIVDSPGDWHSNVLELRVWPNL